MINIIFGAGSHGKVVYDILRRNEVANEKILFADVYKKRDSNFMGCKIIGGLEEENIVFPKNDFEIILSYVGDPKRGITDRKKMVEKIKSQLSKVSSFKGFSTIVDKSAIISEKAKLGRNVSIGVNSFLNIDSIIGDHVIINNYCNIEHDVEIGDHCIISPNVAILGNVKISENVFIGSGSILRNNIKIGTNSIVGMGSVVVMDVPENSIVKGNPAKITPI